MICGRSASGPALAATPAQAGIQAAVILGPGFRGDDVVEVFPPADRIVGRLAK